MPSTISRFFLIALIALCSANANSRQLDIDEQQAVIDKIIELIEAEFFDPDAAGAYLTYLQQQGRNVIHPVTAEDLALHLHRGLQQVTRDGHLGVYAPRRAAAIMGQPMFEDEPGDVPQEPHDSQTHEDNVPTFTVSHPSRQLALITMGSFPTTDHAGDALLAELTQLSNETALIFDLRGNMGGDAKLFRRIAGCLFDGSMPLFAIRWREPDGVRVAESRVEPDSDCQHLTDNAVVILVDQHTASVGELMPFIMQARGRATIVGQPTYGASHAAEFYPLPSGLGLMLPIGATYDPQTGLDWEGGGVIPDVITPADKALDKALSLLEILARCEESFESSWGCDFQSALAPHSAQAEQQ